VIAYQPWSVRLVAVPFQNCVAEPSLLGIGAPVCMVDVS
jgi:hypothetical protein